MAANSLDRHLTQLEACRYRFGSHESAHVVKLLRRLDAARFADPASLIRFHEALLFLRAFPQGPSVVRATGRILNSFRNKVEALRKGSADMDDFDTFEVSGIAGTEMEDTLSFDVARWLIKRMPGRVEIAWDHYEPGRELGTTGPRFIPLLEDDAYVEADTPWRQWLEAAVAKPARKTSASPARLASWLISRFEQLPLPPAQKAELYESLRVPLRWSLENSLISRTRNWKPVRRVFYHSEPLISRSQVSLPNELARRPPKLTKLSRKQGEQVMDMIREVMLVRYRELYGTTLGDAASVVRTDLGRGVTIYLWNLPPARRLPLRAYVAGLTLKNGVPINYIEAMGLCDWIEIGFNTFYTYRQGETAWIYAQVLRSLRQLTGATTFSVYPYQIGKNNDEGIDSGAFWFYRKLGFRSGRPDLEQLARREEQKIAADPRYRTPPRTLKRLAAAHVFYELCGYDLSGSKPGAWDNFSTRNLGLRVNRRMADKFEGDSTKIRQASPAEVGRALAITPARWSPTERRAFENWALVLALIPDLRRWSTEEKQDVVKIIRAQAAPNEMRYLRRTQHHPRLRDELLRLGSCGADTPVRRP